MKRYSFFVSLIAVASACLALMANLISGRLGYFGPFIAPMGVFFFPLIYVLSDVTSEVYGYRVSRYIAWISALINVFFVAGIMLVVSINTPAPWCIDTDNAIKSLLVGTSGISGMLRVSIAGIIGSVLGGWVNDVIFQFFKHKEGDKGFAKRKFLSSFGAEIVDTTVFITLGFMFSSGWSIQMYFVQFILKYVVEVITEPLAHLLANKLKKYEGKEVFEDRNKFNIFGFEKKVKNV